MKRSVLIALVFSAAVTLAACAAAQPPAPVVKLTNGKLVIGIINDQSGPYADIGGKKDVTAAQMAIEDFKAKYGDNALGGPIELIDADHQQKPDLGAAKAQEFYDKNGASVILDGNGSAVALAISDIAKQKKKLYIDVNSFSTDLTGPKCNKYTFHYTVDSYMAAATTAAWVTKNVGKNWYIVYPDYGFGQDLNKYFVAAVKAAGGNVIQSAPSPWPNPTGDFAAILQKAQAAKPSVLATMNGGADLVNLVRQYNVLKLNNQGIKLTIAALQENDIKVLGPDAFAGVVYPAPWLWNMDDQSRAFADKFLKRTNDRPNWVNGGVYSVTWQYLEAVRRAGTDNADAVVKQLEGYQFSDMFIRNGTFRPEDHWLVHDTLMAQVKPKAEVKETWDFSKVLATLPGNQVSRPLAETGCNMPVSQGERQ
jgi:branched-chain amino acid transport system substrate-binding protein